MAIPTSKPLSLSTVQTEYGGSNPISMSEYRGKGNAPASGAIDLWGDFNGTSNTASIEIRVYGATGGDRGANAGGHGGYTQFTATVVPGTTFSLYAGGAGEDAGSNEGGAGGAGSYVTVGSTLIAVAGGGGGGASQYSGGAGGGSNNAGSNGGGGSTGGSGGSGGVADNTGARYSGNDGYDWTDPTFPGRGGGGGQPAIAPFPTQPGENPGNKALGGYGGDASSQSDEGGGGGGGGYGGGAGGQTSDFNGIGFGGAGGGGYRRTTDLTGITAVGGGGSNGSNAGHGYIQVYNGGSLVATVTATTRSGASGSYTVP